MAAVKLPPLPKLSLSLKPLIRHLRLVYLILLLLLVAETIFIVTRDVDDQARARAEALYPPRTVQFTAAQLEALRNLQSSPSIAPSGGKGNPFIP